MRRGLFSSTSLTKQILFGSNGITDSEVRGHCRCPAAEREVRFFACRDKVVALMHHNDPDEGEVTPLIDEITEVSFLCPFKWASAVILYP